MARLSGVLAAASVSLVGVAILLSAYASAATRNVSVQDNVYVDGVSGNSITTIFVGDTVQWTWAGEGVEEHTVSSTSSEAFDSGNPQTTGSYSHQFDAVGSYSYLCGIHGTDMQGTIIVQAAAPTATNSPQPTSTPVPPTNTPVPGTETAVAANTSTPVAPSTPGAAPTGASEQPTLAAQAAQVAAVPRTGTGRGNSTGNPWRLLLIVGGGLVGLSLVAIGRRRPIR